MKAETAVHRIPELEAVGERLVAGITTRVGASEAGGEGDFGLSTGGQGPVLERRYDRLATALGFTSVVVGRQVHGTTLLQAGPGTEPGFRIAGKGDGLVAAPAGRLMVVTVADCVPVYLVDSASGRLGLLHAGWRGTAADLLARGIERLTADGLENVSALHVHLGPAVCGSCYEVGPRVLEALGCPGPGRRAVDLRGLLAARALELGVVADNLSISTFCTRCRSDLFHSHRAAADRSGRMAAFLGRTA